MSLSTPNPQSKSVPATRQNTSLSFLTSRRCIDDRFGLSKKPQEYIIITGPSGSGKSMQGIDLVLNALRDGKPVHVLDVGKSYEKLCETVGGTCVTMISEHQSTKIVHGSCPLVIYDLEQVTHTGQSHCSLPLGIHAAHTLLLIDELWHASALLPDLATHIKNHLTAGGSVALLTQDSLNSNVAQELMGMDIPNTVRKSIVALSRF